MGEGRDQCDIDAPTYRMQDGSKHTVARRLPRLSAYSREGETARGGSRRARQEVGGDLSSGWAGARAEPALFVDSFLWKANQDAKRCEAMRSDAIGCRVMCYDVVCVLAVSMEWNRKVEFSLGGNDLSRRQVQLYWRIWGRRGSGCLGCDTRARVPPLSDPRPEDLPAIYLKNPAGFQRILGGLIVDEIKPNRHFYFCVSAPSVLSQRS